MGSLAELRECSYRGKPSIAVYVNGRRYASVKKEFIEETLLVLHSDTYVRAEFPHAYTHIRHRSLDW